MGNAAAKRETPGETIELRVALQADLRRYMAKGETGPKVVHLRSGATVADLLAELGIPDAETVTVGVDGELAQKDAELHDGADVTMFSPMEGG
jgi:sulfur carrier protein ThiS